MKEKGERTPPTFRVPSLGELPERSGGCRPEDLPRPVFTPTPEGDLPLLGEGSQQEDSENPKEERQVWRLKQRLQKKHAELEDLRRRLARLEREWQVALRAKGKAEMEASRLRKDYAALEEELAQLRKQWEEAQAQLNLLLPLREENKTLREEVVRLGEKVASLQKEAKRGEAWARAQAFQEALPAPFPLEVFSRVLFLDYRALGTTPEERLLALAEGYKALLAGHDHPALQASTRELIQGDPEGIALVGLERLLLDLANSPLLRWLRTHAWLLEARLRGGGLHSPREEG